MIPDYAALVKRLLAYVESNDIDGYLGSFAPDAEYLIGNSSPVVGNDAIRAAIAQVSLAVQGVTHELRDIFTDDGGVVIVHSDVQYRRRDGKTFRIPSLAILHFIGEKIRRYQAFIDTSPVFVPSKLDSVIAMETAAARGDWDHFESFLTEDVLFVVGSAVEVNGPQKVAGFYRETQEGALKITGADIRGTWEFDDVVIIEMDVRGQPAGGGPPVVYPSVDVFRFRGGRIFEWRTYPVYPTFIRG